MKKAHRTHALAQPAGEPYPHLDPAQLRGGSADGRLLASWGELRQRVPDAADRARMLGVSAELEDVWERGAALPVLRAHRKALERALRNAPR